MTENQTKINKITNNFTILFVIGFIAIIVIAANRDDASKKTFEATPQKITQEQLKECATKCTVTEFAEMNSKIKAQAEEAKSTAEKSDKVIKLITD